MSRIRAVTQRRLEYRARLNDIYRRRQRQIWMRMRNAPVEHPGEQAAHPGEQAAHPGEQATHPREHAAHPPANDEREPTS